MSRIVPLHGVPLLIISDRGSLFVSKFWQSFQEALGTRLNFSTAYHPQTDGQTERVNQVLEDMLRACVISFGKSWEKYLPLVTRHRNRPRTQKQCDIAHENGQAPRSGPLPLPPPPVASPRSMAGAPIASPRL